MRALDIINKIIIKYLDGNMIVLVITLFIISR